jgi:DNA-binding MarR family transcriptional regulator
MVYQKILRDEKAGLRQEVLLSGGIMRFLSLRYFLVTVEEMHFSRAAQRLFITQQTLSMHIKRLEEQYAVKLGSD